MATFTEEYKTDDKSGWGEGPWQSEPDKVVWVDQATGLDCMAHRSHSGNWCGYAGVPEGHPLYGKDYDDVGADVHGGLSYSAGCQEGTPPEHGICHLPQPGRPERVWWFGFDCAHFMDFMPGMAARLAELRRDDPERWPVLGTDFGEQYWTLDMVIAEVEGLAAEIAALR